jgi:ABC-type branched-subunit amino acid transport system permease subunit
MTRLVTGLFYERREAERAVETLKAHGIPSAEIYLEAEVTPTPEIGRKGGAVARSEVERRFAGLETGVVIGLTVGVLAGLGFGMLGGVMTHWMRSIEPTSTGMPFVLGSPLWAAIAGGLIGTIAGALIGWVVDFTLTRAGAGPPLPAQETLVTVRTDEGKLQEVYADLFLNRARHLHVAERAI